MVGTETGAPNAEYKFCPECRSDAALFFKQKTAYAIASSDWSSDVCSSDLMAIDRKLNQHLIKVWETA